MRIRIHRIHMFSDLLDPDPSIIKQNSKISTVLRLLLYLLSLKNYVNVPSKSNMQKTFFLKISFLLASWRSMMKIEWSGSLSGSGSEYTGPDPLVRGMDPRIRIHTKMSWIRNTGFAYVSFIWVKLYHLDLPFLAEASRWVFSQLRDRGIFESDEDKVGNLETFFAATKELATASKPTSPCLIHSGINFNLWNFQLTVMTWGWILENPSVNPSVFTSWHSLNTIESHLRKVTLVVKYVISKQSKFLMKIHVPPMDVVPRRLFMTALQ